MYICHFVNIEFDYTDVHTCIYTHTNIAIIYFPYTHRGYEKGQLCNDLHDMKFGLQSHDHHCRLTRHGPNRIDVPVKPYYVLFVEEVLHPFYIFQVVMSDTSLISYALIWNFTDILIMTHLIDICCYSH